MSCTNQTSRAAHVADIVACEAAIATALQAVVDAHTLAKQAQSTWNAARRAVEPNQKDLNDGEVQTLSCWDVWGAKRHDVLLAQQALQDVRARMAREAR